MAPERIALAVAVPATPEEFRLRLNSSDFLLRYAASSDAPEVGRTTLDWDGHYATYIGGPVRVLTDSAQTLGVQVCPASTLADITRLTAECSIVIVLAHWKGSEIPFHDLHAECTPEALKDRLTERLGQLSQWIARRTDKGAWWTFGKQAPPVLQVLREAVALGWEGEPERQVVDGRVSLPITLAARRREEMDRLLTGLLKPGNRIELFDGLHTKEVFESAIAPDFTGSLDLTICTSTILGDHISRARGGRLRLTEFPQEQELLWHAQCLPIAIEITLKENVPYQEARMLADAIVRQAIDELH